MENKELKKIANRVRQGIIEAVYSGKSGHPGGSLSACDIMTYLFFEEMNIDPKNPEDPKRDRFVLSKGHATPLYYSVLANRGFTGASRYEAYSGGGYVHRVSRTGSIMCGGNGSIRQGV